MFAAGSLLVKTFSLDKIMTANVRQYDLEFHKRISSRSVRSAEIVLGRLFSHKTPNSIIDVGGGRGNWAKAALSLGVEAAMVIDAPGAPTDEVVGKVQFLGHDLLKTLPQLCRRDLAICVEVAEHLPPTRAEGFVAELCQLSDVVLFSAAIPFQGGDGHLNEMWPEYWAALFSAHGRSPWDILRHQIWKDRRVDWWYRQNALVFAPPDWPCAPYGARPANPGDLTRIHPEAWIASRRRTPPAAQRYSEKRDIDIYHDPSGADHSAQIGYGGEFDSAPHPGFVEPLFAHLRGVIVGPGRVGSTCLADVVARHPAFHCLNESHDAPVLAARFGDGPVETKSLINVWRAISFAGGASVGEMNARRAGASLTALEVFLERVAASRPMMTVAAFRRLMGGFMLWASGKRALIDKTPDYAMHLPLMAKGAPDLRALLMVRSPVPTILSMRRHEGYRRLAGLGEASWPEALLSGDACAQDRNEPEDLSVYLEIWRRRVAAALAFGEERDPTCFSILRYEDLVAAPERELARVARFFGEDADKPWLTAASDAVRPAGLVDAGECAEAIRTLVASPDALELAKSLGYAPTET